jgi:hypothetical protein
MLTSTGHGMTGQLFMCVVNYQCAQVAPLTEAELEAITIVFHQFETGLREGTIYARVSSAGQGRHICLTNKLTQL